VNNMVDIVNPVAHNDNMLVKQFVKDNRVGGEVQTLTVKVKVYKRNAIPTLSGNNSIHTYTDQSITKYIKTGKNYLDFNNATPLVEKSFTYTVPNSERTSATQTHATKSVRDEYIAKKRAWNLSMQATDDYANCYNALWTDLDALDVTW